MRLWTERSTTSSTSLQQQNESLLLNYEFLEIFTAYVLSTLHAYFLHPPKNLQTLSSSIRHLIACSSLPVDSTKRLEEVETLLQQNTPV
jgi:hypothetical protein